MLLKRRILQFFSCALLLVLFSKCACNNTTDRYIAAGDKKVFESRQHRLLTFETKDDGEIEVELAFHLPFVTIPVKKSLEMGKGILANIDTNAILLGGGLVLALGIAVPALFMLTNKKLTETSNIYRSDEQSKLWKLMTILDEVLIENNVDTTSCAQKLLCWVVKNSKMNVLRGDASSSDKIIDGLVSSEWLKKILEETSFESAIENAINGNDCTLKYNSCKLTQKNILSLYEKITDLGNFLNY